MDNEEIFAKLRDIVEDIMGVDADIITMDTTFDDLDADSLDRLQFVTAVEDEFDIEIPDDKMLAINSVSTATEAISELAE